MFQARQSHTLEHSGLQWVGVSGVDGTFRGVLVEPGDGYIQRSVQLRALRWEQIPDAG